MAIPVEISGIVVLSVVITACTIFSLGVCLWPVIQELRKAKRLKEQQNNEDDLSISDNIKRERL